MRVQDLMSSQVHCCAPDDSLEQAAQMMWEHDCGSLPVCEGTDGTSRTIGIVTDRDICMCALFQSAPLSQLRVRTAMAQKVLACRPTDSIEQAEALMRQNQVRRLPVLDEQGSLTGVLSLADLARAARGERERVQQELSERQVGDTLAGICAPQAQRLFA